MVGSTVTVQTPVGNINARQAPQSGNPASTLFATFQAPLDMAPGAGMTVRIRWMGPTTGSAVHWRLGAIQCGGQNMAAQSYSVVAHSDGAPSASGGFETFTDLTLPNTVAGNAWSSGTALLLAISRVASDAGDTLADVADMFTIDVYSADSNGRRNARSRRRCDGEEG
jgi:hypothetical protein